MIYPSTLRTNGLRPLLLAATPFLLCLPAQAQAAELPDPERTFLEAFWLEHEGEQPAAALERYRSLAAMGEGELAERAEGRAAELSAQLASRDLAGLMPEDSIVYLELTEPGARIETLLEELGLTGEGIDLGDRRLAISPTLVRELLGLKGIAVAVTSMEGGMVPGGVAVLDPGHLDVVRGLLETVLPAGGKRVGELGGHETWLVEEMLWVTMTKELVIAGTSPELVEGVLGRMGSQAGTASLLDNDDLASSLALRDDSLLFSCINLEPVMPQLRMLMNMASRQEPELAGIFELLDLESTQTLAARLSVKAEGIGLDVALELDEDHRNLAFDLLRLPALDSQSLAGVPAGVAAFASMALNPKGSLPTGDHQRTAAMDLGRELFGNLTQVSAFVLPGDLQSSAVPDMGLCLHVNDLERSANLWSMMLSVASVASRSGAPTPVTVGGHEAKRYLFEGQPVFILPHNTELLVATSERALGAAVEARHAERSVLDDEGFAEIFASAANGTAMAGVHMGRISGFVLPMTSEYERREMSAALQLLSQTTLSVALGQDSSSLSLRAALLGIPDVSGVLAPWMSRELGVTLGAPSAAYPAMHVASR